MKILHVAETVPGGIASYLDECLPRQADKYGIENVTLLVPSDQQHHLFNSHRWRINSYMRTGRNPLSLVRLVRAYRRVCDEEQPHLVHLHSTFAGFAVRLAQIGRSRSSPKVVYCAHGWAFTMDSSRWKQKLFAVVERLLAPVTDAIICISTSEQEAAVIEGLPSRKLHLVHNGIDPNPPEEGQSVLMSKDAINLLFVGRMDPQKGFDVLVAAMTELQDMPIRLHVIGENVVSRGGTVVKYPDNIQFHGWLPRRDASASFACADAVIIPSRWEGFGLVALEAMRAGTPVYASAVGGLRETVTEEVGGLFPPDDVAAIVNVIRGINTTDLAEKGRRARERVRNQFSADAMNSALFRIYHQLVPIAAHP